ncbi:hypothetical protein PNOK_0695800 [Pyrrhoderma noxium]|uniref:RNase H type-1 domain-containing protein n=1 Tax=Pyrrhoderma noxium TaxID=2282107 RepID=A0A286UBJ3_9AGAM|nr:hypothetical protein PNOK_0695800 [Pyrrhoderma noxium]
MSTSSSGSKRPRSPSATPKGKKTRSFAGFSSNPPPIPIPVPFDFNMEVNNTPVSLSPSSSPFLSPSQSVQPDLASGSPEEFTREWSNVLKDIAVISSDRVVDPASIMGQVVPIFMRLSNFIFSSVTSPIPVVESEGRHLARKLFYFASENYAQVDGAFTIVNEKKLSHTISSIVDDSNIDLTAKVDNLSNQIVSLQQSLLSLSTSVARISNSATVHPPPPPKKPNPPQANPTSSSVPKPSFSSIVKKKQPEPVAHVEEVSGGPFQSVSYKKPRSNPKLSNKITSSESTLSKYTQICIFPTTKLQRGIDDISSKVNSINKALPLDKVPKNFYCVMGRITAQGNMVLCFPNSFSFDLIIGFKNIILNTLSLPHDTLISPVTSEHGYYITGVPIKHPDTGLPLTESALLKELKINYPDVPFIKANILPLSNNPKFAGSQLGSANIFVSMFSISNKAGIRGEDREKLISDINRSVEYSPNSLFFFTDGSATLFSEFLPFGRSTQRRYRNVTGSAVVMYFRGKIIGSRRDRHSPSSTAFDAELFAIHKALQIAQSRLSFSSGNSTPAIQKVIIYTDSSSSLQLLSTNPSKFLHHPVYVKIFKLATSLLTDFPDLTINLNWCPGHKGVFGNEEADLQAGKACASRIPTSTPITASFCALVSTKDLLDSCSPLPDFAG